MKTKNYLSLLTMLIIVLFTACEKETLQTVSLDEAISVEASTPIDVTDIEGNLKRKCPRQDLDMSEIYDVHKLADELDFASNCGRTFRQPECDDDGELFTDESTVLVDQWCSPFTTCACNYFPDDFSISDQDDLIDEAKSLLIDELTTCGIDEANFDFYATIELASTCENIIIKLFATGRSICCVYDK